MRAAIGHCHGLPRLELLRNIHGNGRDLRYEYKDSADLPYRGGIPLQRPSICSAACGLQDQGLFQVSGLPDYIMDVHHWSEPACHYLLYLYTRYSLKHGDAVGDV